MDTEYDVLALCVCPMWSISHEITRSSDPNETSLVILFNKTKQKTMPNSTMDIDKTIYCGEKWEYIFITK